jgi:hypothetical protein
MTRLSMPSWAASNCSGPRQPVASAIIGTGQTREDWAAGHDDETFRETREHLAGLEDGPSRTTWYDVVETPDRHPARWYLAAHAG